jgi:hypothetical protein
MKRNLLAGLVFALAVPAAAFAAGSTTSAQTKKHAVVAQANTSMDGKSTAKADDSAKSKKKAHKAKSASPTPKNGAAKSEQVK